MGRNTKLRRELSKLLLRGNVEVADVFAKIREHIDDPSCFQELFPVSKFDGTITRRSDAPPVVQSGFFHEQRQKAAARSNQVRQEARALRVAKVKAFLVDKGENLSLNEIAKLLNETDIRPAQGGVWTRFKVHRLLSEDGVTSK